jgi:adenine-specific DNA-methyltransferase
MPPRNQRNNGPISVSSLKHDDKRVNIPTEELRDFVSDAEKAPQTMLYPRDPSLDPQLVWKGKDEQDRHPLAVPVVPIYIQEKIHPQAIVEAIRAEARKEVEPQADLFSDFNGITFENLIDFYAHEQNWSNRMILGDSLTVMTSLAEKEGLKGKVQMIYLDPPYGIKFGSNWQVSTRKREVKDGKAEDASREPEVVKAFRDTWELGIHSYLAYLRDRLVLARELLGETGSVFVQIGEENLHLVRCLLDEVMGSENFCSIISFRKTTTQAGDLLPDTNDYVLWYGRSRLQVKHRTPYLAREGSDWVNYDFVRLPSGEHRRMSSAELRDTCPVPDGGTIYRRSPLTSASASLSTSMDITYEGKTFSPGKGGWKTNRVGFSRLAAANRLESYGATLSYRRYITDFPYFPLSNSWIDTASGGYGDDKVYVVQTNAKVIARCMLMTTDPGDLVLDPTCGSGTTAYVAEQWGRRWITVDTSRVALALARTRLMAARYPYYYLADSAEGVKKGGEVTGIVPPEYRTTNDVRKGFVYRRVPHVTLKSIANNPDIDSIHDRWQAKLDPLLAKLNKAAGAKWLEWEVPRPDAPEAAKLAKMAKETLAQWWALRRDRQQEIDASIAHHADTETLFDQPYEDGKRVRVAGPFTVESLSPHRVLSTADGSPIAGLVHDDGSGTPSTAHLARKGPSPDYPGAAGDDAGSFVTMLIDNLRASGVKGTEKGLADQVRPARSLCRPLAAGFRRIHRCRRKIEARRGRVRPRAGHRRAGSRQGGGEGGSTGRRFRPSARLRLCLRSPRVRRSEALRQARRARHADESRPRDGRRAPEEDRGGQPLHGVRRARHPHPRRGWPGGGRDPRRRRLRPDHRRDSLALDRRHRVLVHRHRLQRRGVLRSPRLLHGRRRAVPETEACAARRRRRGGVVGAALDDEPSVRPAVDRPDRGQGHQSLRRRGAEDVRRDRRRGKTASSEAVTPQPPMCLRQPVTPSRSAKYESSIRRSSRYQASILTTPIFHFGIPHS